MPSPLLKRSLYATPILIPLTYYYYTRAPTHKMTATTPSPCLQTTKSLPPYTATFQVPLSCTSCTTSITNALSHLPGLSPTQTTFSIPQNLVTTTGTAPPSQIIHAIQSTGRAAVLRGTGQANSAAVCILETPWDSGGSEGTKEGSSVRGLARLIQLTEGVTLLDLTVSGLGVGRWRASIRERGDVSRGREGLGGVLRGGKEEGDGREAWIGEVEVGGGGRGSVVGEIDWRVWEVVGRGVLLERVGRSGGGVRGGAGGGEEVGDAVLGVIARSAGVWENDKVICSCSGKTVWEEREEMVGRGML